LVFNFDIIFRCGSSTAHCGTGCQGLYGTCTASPVQAFVITAKTSVKRVFAPIVEIGASDPVDIAYLVKNDVSSIVIGFISAGKEGVPAFGGNTLVTTDVAESIRNSGADVTVAFGGPGISKG
jgi:hypothetical protein